MGSWHSYPSIYNLGHAAVRDLLTVPHVVEEKVDGSQFSFGVFAEEVLTPDPEGGSPCVHGEHVLRVRSKGAVMLIDAPEKMFTKAVESVKERQHLLQVGWTYRAEYLQKPKHNSLAYDRVPNGHIIIFDVNSDEERWLSPEEKRAEAERIGLECVPVLFQNQTPETTPTQFDDLRTIIDSTMSVLGGQKIEGIVIKPLVPLYGRDKKTLMGKFVSERFKEVHSREWKTTNPSTGDIIDRLTAAYTSPARWHKAIQHLRDAGRLTNSLQDIGMLIREIPADVRKECESDIKDMLFDWAWPKVSRSIVRGFPEFYKNELLKQQFQTEEAV